MSEPRWEFGLDGKSEGSHGGYLRRRDRDNPDLKERARSIMHWYAHVPHEHIDLGPRIATALNDAPRLQRMADADAKLVQVGRNILHIADADGPGVIEVEVLAALERAITAYEDASRDTHPQQDAPECR